MSQKNVETFRRLVDDGGRRDAQSLLAYVSPNVEWHPALPQSLGGNTTVYRGHQGIRQLMSELDQAVGSSRFEMPDVRSLGDRVLGLGRVHIVGRISGVETESPFAYLVDFEDGSPICVRSYLDHERALEAAGLQE
jgi:ketosteroid isomerase-like protein